MRNTTPPTVDSTSAVSRGFGARGRIHAHQPHLAADGLFHELGGRQQVVVEVLLDQHHVGRDEAHGLRHDLRRDARELDALPARGRADGPHVLDERDVLVVDGERDLAVRRAVRAPSALAEPNGRCRSRPTRANRSYA